MFPSNVAEHYGSMLNDKEIIAFHRKRLLKTAQEAVAWGVPDRESTGYSHGELTKIIRDLLKYIEYLESSLAQR